MGTLEGRWLSRYRWCRKYCLSFDFVFKEWTVCDFCNLIIHASILRHLKLNHECRLVGKFYYVRTSVFVLVDIHGKIIH